MAELRRVRVSSKPNTLSPDDVEAYAAYIVKWQSALNLNDWRIVQSSKVPGKGVMSEIDIHLPDHLAVYRLGQHFGAIPVTPWSLEATAVHELLHIHCAELVAATKGEVTDDVRMAAEHRFIHILERLLVPNNET